MVAILIIAGLTAVNQLLGVIDDWQKSEGNDKPHALRDFMKREKIKVISFFFALGVTIVTGFLFLRLGEINKPNNRRGRQCTDES